MISTYGRVHKIHGLAGWGEGETPSDAGYVQTLQTYAPLLVDLYKKAQDKPAYLRMEEARLELQRLVASGGSLKDINAAKAAYDAAKRDVQLEAEGLRSSREWSTLGKLGLAVGVGIGGTIMLAILLKVAK